MDDDAMQALLAELPKDMCARLEKRMAQGERYPFPHALNGGEAMGAYFAALAHAVGPYKPWEHPLLTIQQSALVQSGAAALVEASILLISRFFPQDDCTFFGLATLLGMAESRPRKADFRSPATMMFKQVSEGCKYRFTPSGWSLVPSRLVRTTDGLRPCDQVKPDGTHGFTAAEEPAVAHYQRYRAYERAFAKLDSRLDFALSVKRALLPKCPVEAREKLFTKREQVCNELIEAADAVDVRYHELLLQGDGSLDLLDRLSIEGMLKVLMDERRLCDERLPYLRSLNARMA